MERDKMSMKKGAIQVFDYPPELVEIDLDKPLTDLINKKCCKFQLQDSYIMYGLKIMYNKNGKWGCYLTEENKFSLDNGFKLKLDYSADFMVEKIFRNLQVDRRTCFEDLYNLATDAEFIKSLVIKGRYEQVLCMLQDERLVGKEAAACFVTILHLLKLQIISDIEYDHLVYIIQFANNDSNIDELHYAYSVLSQILYQRGPTFNKPKEKIINDLSVSTLLKRLSLNSSSSEFKPNTLQLVNAMVRAVQGDARIQLIKEMKLKCNRELIHKYILGSNFISDTTAQELHAYQTYLFSLHKESLNTYMDPNNNALIKDLFDGVDDVIPRSSTLFEFESNFIVKRSNSQDTILSNDDFRISLASLKSIRTMKSIGSYASVEDHLDEECISYLTVECLSHYKNSSYTNFCQSKYEESQFKSGIFTTAERVTKLLAKILKVGKEPNKHNQLYQPLIFHPEFKPEFFPELFSRTMWMLSKTRKEMKASTNDDFDKVMKILKKQIEYTLRDQPKCYKSLLERMKYYSYSVVSKELEKEYEKDIKKVLENNPCVIKMKKQYQEENEKIIFNQKMNIMQKGTCLRKLPIDKKKNEYIYLKLSNNKKMLYFGDWDNQLKEYMGQKVSINVSNIKHFLNGKHCPHVKDGSVKKYNQAFTIILLDGTKFNFLAENEPTAAHWIDGLNLLLDKEHRTEQYGKDLIALTEMDCLLQLIELQNIKIPSTPPPVPKPPTTLKPAIPPRPSPQALEKMREMKRQTIVESIIIPNNTENIL